MICSFDVNIAMRVGVNAAIVYNYISYMTCAYASVGETEERFTIRGITMMFPFMSEFIARESLNKLVSFGLISMESEKKRAGKSVVYVVRKVVHP